MALAAGPMALALKAALHFYGITLKLKPLQLLLNQAQKLLHK